jgi:hypothetical protein
MIRHSAIFLLLIFLIQPSAVDASEDGVYFSLEYKEPVNVLDYFPLEVGNRWVYENTHEKAVRTMPERPEKQSREDGPCDPSEYCGPTLVKRFIKEVVVTAHYDVPEGKVIMRQVREKDISFEYPPDTDPEETKGLTRKEKVHLEPYLIKGNYVFNVPEWGWDKERKDLTPRFRERLEDSIPAFFFPIGNVHLWAERAREERDYRQGELWKQGKGPPPNPGMYYWVVEKSDSVKVPYAEIKNVYFLMYRTTGGPSMVWFKEGIGVVKTAYVHSGTYLRSSSELKAYYPADK